MYHYSVASFMGGALQLFLEIIYTSKAGFLTPKV